MHEGFAKKIIPEVNRDLDKTKFNEALKLKDMELSGNPTEKYSRDALRGFAKQSMEGGEYKPYTEDVIEKTKADLLKLYEKVEETGNAKFTPNEEMKKLIEESQEAA